MYQSLEVNFHREYRIIRIISSPLYLWTNRCIVRRNKARLCFECLLIYNPFLELWSPDFLKLIWCSSPFKFFPSCSTSFFRNMWKYFIPYALCIIKEKMFFSQQYSNWWTSKSSIEHDRVFLSGVSALCNPILDVTVMTLRGVLCTHSASFHLYNSFVVIN